MSNKMLTAFEILNTFFQVRHLAVHPHFIKGSYSAIKIKLSKVGCRINFFINFSGKLYKISKLSKATNYLNNIDKRGI